MTEYAWDVVGVISLLLLWTLGTVFLSAMVGMAMSRTRVVYVPGEEPYIKDERRPIEKCSWQRLYGIGLILTGAALVLSHPLIDNCTFRNLSLGWGIATFLLGVVLWGSFSLGHRFHRPE